MSAAPSELVALARLNGDFQRNYGRLIGAYLYLRSIGAVTGRRYILSMLLFAVFSAFMGWFERHVLTWLHVG